MSPGVFIAYGALVVLCVVVAVVRDLRRLRASEPARFDAEEWVARQCEGCEMHPWDPR